MSLLSNMDGSLISIGWLVCGTLLALLACIHESELNINPLFVGLDTGLILDLVRRFGPV